MNTQSSNHAVGSANDLGGRSPSVEADGPWGDPSPDLTESPIDGLQLDTVYDLLSNRRRRLILHFLTRSSTQTAPIGALATQIAAWENEKPLTEVTTAERKRAYNTLQQSHLPRLRSAGIVDLDADDGTVSLEIDPGQLDVFLSFLPRSGSRGFTTLIVLGVVAWFGLTATWVTVHVLHLASPGSMLLAVPLAILLFAAIQFYLVRYFL